MSLIVLLIITMVMTMMFISISVLLHWLKGKEYCTADAYYLNFDKII